MSTEQISGVLVHARPELAATVAIGLDQLPGVQVHDHLESSRFVVIIESPNEREMADTFSAVRNVEGVLSASLTYHYADQTSSLDEELPA